MDDKSSAQGGVHSALAETCPLTKIALPKV